MRFSSKVLSVAFILGLAVLYGSYGSMGRDSDIHIYFRYGVMADDSYGRNVLDTYRGTYTKDMVVDEAVTTTLVLTDEELETIYRKMMEIDFFSFPELYKPEAKSEVTCVFTPASSYHYEVTYNWTVKKVTWSNAYYCSEDQETRDLMALNKVILSIVESKPEYQALPEPKEGYN